MRDAGPDEPAVARAYRHCQAICARNAKTFALAGRFLPPARRRAIWAVYAFCRHADDLVDRPGPHGPAALTAWRDELLRAYDGHPRHPIMVAYADVLRRFPVPLPPALDLLLGMEMDLAPVRYRTWEDLAVYCYRVGSTAGLLTLPILGYRSPRALEHAVDLGIAMQLTNILRDVGEDARMGRVYLPEADLQRFGYSVERLMSGVVDAPFHDLMAFEIARARHYYARGLPGVALLEPPARLGVHLAGVLYRQILTRIEANNCDVFSRRAHLSTAAKLYHGLLSVRDLATASRQ